LNLAVDSQITINQQLMKDEYNKDNELTEKEQKFLNNHIKKSIQEIMLKEKYEVDFLKLKDDPDYAHKM
jgi:hypothetical protein